MKKWILLSVISMIVLGCQATKYQAIENAKPSTLVGKTITEKQFLSLQDMADSMIEDKTDYLFIPPKDPFETTVEIVDSLTPIGTLFPLAGLVLGVVGTAARMGRKYKPIVETGKEDAEALYEMVRGILKAGNGKGIKSITGQTLSANLSASTSDKTKVKIKTILAKLAHEKVDES